MDNVQSVAPTYFRYEITNVDEINAPVCHHCRQLRTCHVIVRKQPRGRSVALAPRCWSCKRQREVAVRCQVSPSQSNSSE